MRKELEQKVAKTLEIVSRNVRNDEMALAFSGGRDSTILKYIIQTYLPAVNLKCIYIQSGLEGQTFLDYLASHHKDILCILPERDIFSVMKEVGHLPRRKAMYCCDYFMRTGFTKLYTMYACTASAERGDEYWHPKITRDTVIDRTTYTSYIDKDHKVIYPMLDWELWDSEEYADETGILLAHEYYDGIRPYSCPYCAILSRQHRQAIGAYYPELEEKYLEVCHSIWHDNETIRKAYDSPESYWQAYLALPGAKDERLEE